MNKVIGVILAGGQARRMGGGDKALLEMNGTSLLRHVGARLAPQVDALVLNANGDLNRFASYQLPVAPDQIEGYAGPLAGVQAGMTWTTQQHPEAQWIATIAADTPFFPPDLVARFLTKAQAEPDNTIILGQSNLRTHPVIGLWPVALKDDLTNALKEGVRKVLDWTARHHMVQCDFELLSLNESERNEQSESRSGEMPDLLDPFFNINRPEDLTMAERIHAERFQYVTKHMPQ